MVKKTNEVMVQQLPVFKTPFNRQAFPRRYETNELPSMTSPDKTLTIKQIIDRFQKGLPLLGQKTPTYIGEGHETAVEDDILLGYNWDTFDLSEKHEIIKQASTDLKKLNKGIEDSRKEAREIRAKKDRDFQAKLKKLLDAGDVSQRAQKSNQGKNDE